MVENTTETLRLLVVSRESALLRPLSSIAKSNSWQIETVASAWDAIERVQSGPAPHLLLLDLPRGDGDTLHILRWLHRLRPDLRVIVTCFADEADQKKREAIRLGAQEVLIRPVDETRLESVINLYLVSPENWTASPDSQEIEHLGPDTFFVCAGPATQRLRVQAELLAEADVPVLVLGEHGSGKDTVGRLIHKLSVRSGFEFLKVNCTDMPAELLEAELFGSDGAFSLGNGRTNPGKFERADKGTIFFDEIAEMPIGLQTRLMQILQDKLIHRGGSEKPIPVDVRILAAATSANIERALAERKLREDLYYRLSAFTIQVPPLRKRKGEIVVLMQHMMHRLARHFGLPPREFSPTVLDACQHYLWPGNLKELESFVKRYLVGGDKELIFHELKSDLAGSAYPSHVPHAPESMTFQPGASDTEEDQPDPESLKSLIHSIKCEAERNAIGTALQKTGWNRKAAARLLRVSYRTMLYKIEQYHLVPPGHSASSFQLRPHS